MMLCENFYYKKTRGSEEWDSPGKAKTKNNAFNTPTANTKAPNMSNYREKDNISEEGTEFKDLRFTLS